MLGPAAPGQPDQVGRGIVAELALPLGQYGRHEGNGREGDPLGTHGPHQQQLLHRHQSEDGGRKRGRFAGLAESGLNPVAFSLQPKTQFGLKVSELGLQVQDTKPVGKEVLG